MNPYIVFLNGTSSAGKSSIAKALQELFVEPSLHIGIDTILFLMSPKYLFEGPQAPQGYHFIRVDDKEGPKVIVKNGPYAQKLNQVKRQTMKALLQANFHLIIDEVLYCESDYQAYMELFKGYQLLFVGVIPPVAVAEQRERERQDRLLGLARGVHPLVHANKTYDLSIDTSQVTPEQAAMMIFTHLTG